MNSETNEGVYAQFESIKRAAKGLTHDDRTKLGELVLDFCADITSMHARYDELRSEKVKIESKIDNQYKSILRAYGEVYELISTPGIGPTLSDLLLQMLKQIPELE
jgi:uncharacterized protein with von Willebrand factor type A (vWA) domain